MRALTGADVYVADQLFATLETRTRKWAIPSWGEVLLSDTVGFVRDLPHSLVASFKSTLEEARQADVLLHVVDVSHPEAEQQVETVEKVLAEIGVEIRNYILVLNKVDKVEDREIIDVLRAKYSHAASVSAVTGQGLDRLAALVAEQLAEGFVEAEIETSVGNGKLFAYLAEHAEVSNREYNENRVTITCRLPRKQVWRLNGADTNVRLLNGALVPPRE